jgi:hypothetical protein
MFSNFLGGIGGQNVQRVQRQITFFKEYKLLFIT